jgi:hypothetical protein
MHDMVMGWADAQRVSHHLVSPRITVSLEATKIENIQIQILCTEARNHAQMHTLARSHAQIAPVDVLQGLAANQDYTENPKHATIRKP